MVLTPLGKKIIKKLLVLVVAGLTLFLILYVSKYFTGLERRVAQLEQTKPVIVVAPTTEPTATPSARPTLKPVIRLSPVAQPTK